MFTAEEAERGRATARHIFKRRNRKEAKAARKSYVHTFSLATEDNPYSLTERDAQVLLNQAKIWELQETI